MARTISIGKQSFAELREGDFFYIDKTGFLRDWWRGGDDVTLICRPRRFGKTLTLSMAECFLSRDYANRGSELFDGLCVWEDADMRRIQGSYPVVSLSFATIKRQSLEESLSDMKRILRTAIRAHDYLRDSPLINDDDKALLESVSDSMDNVIAMSCLGELCRMLYAHHGVKPVILLDEYDTPMQEAWLSGYWEGMSAFMQGLFNATFKTNPSLGRALITGTTRVASESIFSDMNNPRVVTVTTRAYETSFGFTQREIDGALDEFDLLDKRDAVKDWYDGFSFGGASGIYNPWSITNFLNEGQLAPYWMNTSSNGLASSLVRRGDNGLKSDFEALLAGASVRVYVDERVDFRMLAVEPGQVWSLLLAAGYVCATGNGDRYGELDLALTNNEVRMGFDRMVANWFSIEADSYNAFTSALLNGDAGAMTDYLGDLAHAIMSSFDSGRRPSRNQPERFWHGLVLGLLVDLHGRYLVRSNPESGRGRCDVILKPSCGTEGPDDAVVIEFKVFDERRGERDLADTVASALAQIKERMYIAALVEEGFAPERIRAYGIAFRGMEVLVGE